MRSNAFQLRRRHGRSTIHYGHAVDESGHRQLAVYAECQLSGKVVGPIWGHGSKSAKRALALLSQDCDCPAKFHKAVAYEGHKVNVSGVDD